jgi:hypothetical protein
MTAYSEAECAPSIANEFANKNALGNRIQKSPKARVPSLPQNIAKRRFSSFLSAVLLRSPDTLRWVPFLPA